MISRTILVLLVALVVASCSPSGTSDSTDSVEIAESKKTEAKARFVSEHPGAISISESPHGYSSLTIQVQDYFSQNSDKVFFAEPYRWDVISEGNHLLFEFEVSGRVYRLRTTRVQLSKHFKLEGRRWRPVIVFFRVNSIQRATFNLKIYGLDSDEENPSFEDVSIDRELEQFLIVQGELDDLDVLPE